LGGSSPTPQLLLRRSYSLTTRLDLSAAASASTLAAGAEAAIATESYIPPNLTFDKKSSFAPKRKPLLVAPSPPSPLEDDDDDDEMEEGRHRGRDDQLDDDEDEEDDATALILPPQRNLRPVVPLPDRLRVDIRHGVDGTVVGTLWLDPTVFGVDPVRIDLIKQAVDYIRAKIRGRRKAKSKTVSEVSGSGRKVRPQKGSGQARAGHSRPAHWRGGAKAHGPKNTVDYGNVKMNKRQRALAMRSTLSQKLKEGNLILVDHWHRLRHKTKDLARVLQDSYGIGKGADGTTALILDHHLEPDEGDNTDRGDDGESPASYHGVPVNLWVASSNLHKVKVANQRFANVYDILKKEKLVLTLSALEQMERRWRDS
jgi:large subunit ribosomal protein L4